MSGGLLPRRGEAAIEGLVLGGHVEVNGRRVTADEAAPRMVVRFGAQAGGMMHEPNDELAVAITEPGALVSFSADPPR